MLTNVQRRENFLKRLQKNFPDWEFEIEETKYKDNYYNNIVVVRGNCEDVRIMCASDKAVDYRYIYTQRYYWRISNLILKS